jgi:hypothetical protein
MPTIREVPGMGVYGTLAVVFLENHILNSGGKSGLAKSVTYDLHLISHSLEHRTAQP